MSRLEAVRASPRPDTGGWGSRATGNGDLGRLAIVAGSYVVSAKIGLSLSVKVTAIGACAPCPVVCKPVNSNHGVTCFGQPSLR